MQTGLGSSEVDNPRQALERCIKRMRTIAEDSSVSKEEALLRMGAISEYLVSVLAINLGPAEYELAKQYLNISQDIWAWRKTPVWQRPSSG